MTDLEQSRTQPAVDPRVPYLGDAIAALWLDEDAMPTCGFEAQVAVDTLDRWDRENGVQRASAAFVEQLQVDLSRARSALEAVVLAFQNSSATTEFTADGGSTRVLLHAIVAPEMVDRWAALAAGDVS